MAAPPSRLDFTRSRTAWRWAIAGVLMGGLLSLALNLPAAWLSSAVSRATQGRLLLLEAQGSLWNGSAQLVLSAGPGSSDAKALPSRLRWQLRPEWRGNLRLQVEADCCLASPWVWRLSPSGSALSLEISDTPFKLPAQLLTGLGTPWNTVQPQGQLTLQSKQFQVALNGQGLQLSGELSLQLDNLSSQLTTLRPMGSYRVSLQAQPQPRFQLTTLEGRLQLQGQGSWVANRLQFQGEAQASTPADEPVLAHLLSVLGPRQGHKALLKLG